LKDHARSVKIILQKGSFIFWGLILPVKIILRASIYQACAVGYSFGLIFGSCLPAIPTLLSIVLQARDRRLFLHLSIAHGLRIYWSDNILVVPATTSIFPN